MRILFANDGIGQPGGVETYLYAVSSELRRRGHSTAVICYDAIRNRPPVPGWLDLPIFSVGDTGLDEAVRAAQAWRPDLCFSHQMGVLDFEERMFSSFSVVKFMHGYFGTCIQGYKTHAFPRTVCCDRKFGLSCLALFLPRRCGSFNARKMISHYQWALRQKGMFYRYNALIVGGQHMRREFLRNGAPAEKIHVVPLFPTSGTAPPTSVSNVGPEASYKTATIIFLGRMTKLKGGDHLIRAIALANRQLAEPLEIIMAGDGPQRGGWQHLAEKLHVSAFFTGWIDTAERTELLRRAALLAMPSLWPEPFGLGGLEANAMGVPAVAYDVGGVREWLHDGRNGRVVPGAIPNAAALAKVLVQLFSEPGLLRNMRTEALAVAREMSLLRHVDALEPILLRACAPHATSR